MPPDELIADDEVVPAQAPRTLTMRRILWPVLLSLSVLAAVAALTFDYGDYVEAVGSLNPVMFLFAAATVALRVLVGGWRFHYVSGGRLSLAEGTRGQLAWDFFSNVTPSAIGGGPLAIVFMTRDTGVRSGDITAWTLFSMVLDQMWYVIIIPVVLVASLYLEVIPETLGSFGYGVFLLYLIGLLAWIAVFSYATFFRPSLLYRMTDFIFRFRWLRRYRESVGKEMSHLERRAQTLRLQPVRFYVIGLALTFANWSLRYLLILFVVWGVYAPVDKVLVLLRGTALTLASLAMPTPGGSGGIEGLYYLFFDSLMPTSAVAPTLLAWRMLGYYLFIAIGIFLTTHHMQKDVRKGKRRRAKASAEI